MTNLQGILANLITVLLVSNISREGRRILRFWLADMMIFVHSAAPKF